MNTSDYILLSTVIVATIALGYNIYDGNKQRRIIMKQLEKMTQQIWSQERAIHLSHDMKKHDLTQEFAKNFCGIVNDLNFLLVQGTDIIVNMKLRISLLEIKVTMISIKQ